jgi:hypothetical protein
LPKDLPVWEIRFGVEEQGSCLRAWVVMHADTVRRSWEPLIEMTLLESSLGRRTRSLDSYVVDSLLIQKKRCLDEEELGQPQY